MGATIYINGIPFCTTWDFFDTTEVFGLVECECVCVGDCYYFIKD